MPRKNKSLQKYLTFFYIGIIEYTVDHNEMSLEDEYRSLIRSKYRLMYQYINLT